MMYIALFAYAAAMVAANLLVSVFGPIITPLNAFVLIGFDLAMRDWLHIRLRAWQTDLILRPGSSPWLQRCRLLQRR
jgi:hypothetical protein